jgi:hypothetical protein
MAMEKYAPEEAAALGTAAFDMMISLLRVLRENGLISEMQGEDIMREAYWSLMPKAGSRRTFPKAVRDRLTREIRTWIGLPPDANIE